MGRGGLGGGGLGVCKQRSVVRGLGHKGSSCSRSIVELSVGLCRGLTGGLGDGLGGGGLGGGGLAGGGLGGCEEKSVNKGLEKGNVGESIGHVCDSIGLPAELTGGLGGGLGGGELGGGGLAGGGLGGCKAKSVNKGLGEKAMLVSR